MDFARSRYELKNSPLAYDVGGNSSLRLFYHRPKDVSFYVEYADHWQWDLAMYMVSLDIRFMDSGSGQLIAGGVYRSREGVHHGFPDRRQKTLEIIDAMYKSK